MKVTLSVLLASLPALVSASFDVNVCFTLNGSGVENAEVRCKDSDWGTDDDVGPGHAWTDANGCVTITDNQSWWESPDIYCTISPIPSPDGECFGETTTITYNDHNKNEDLFMGTIALAYDEDYCGDFGADANGCGPEWFPGWLNSVANAVSGFDTQCMAHDACYGDCTKTRSECDNDFLADMNLECSNEGTTCLILADIFYEAVSSDAGQDACEAARTACNSQGYLRCGL